MFVRLIPPGSLQTGNPVAWILDATGSRFHTKIYLPFFFAEALVGLMRIFFPLEARQRNPGGNWSHFQTLLQILDFGLRNPGLKFRRNRSNYLAVGQKPTRF